MMFRLQINKLIVFITGKEDNLDKKVEKFTVGSDRLDDLHLAKYDVIASIAHAEMLSKCSIITKDDENKLVDELKNNISKDDLNNQYSI